MRPGEGSKILGFRPRSEGLQRSSFNVIFVQHLLARMGFGLCGDYDCRSFLRSYIEVDSERPHASVHPNAGTGMVCIWCSGNLMHSASIRLLHCSNIIRCKNFLCVG